MITLPNCKRRLSAVLIVSVLISAASCKKKEDPALVCRVDSAVRLFNGDTTLKETFTYAGNDQLMQVGQNGSNGLNKVYTRDVNSIIIQTTAGISFRSRDSVALNAAGRPANFRRYTTLSGNTWENTAYTYNANGELQSAVLSNSGGGISQTITYTYSNGNLVSGSDGSSYSYYENDAARAGDYLLSSQQFHIGAPLFANKNMVKTIGSASGPMLNITYVFGADGRVSRLNAALGGDIYATAYESTCK